MVFPEDLILNHFNFIFPGSYLFEFNIFENVFRENLFNFFSGMRSNNVGISLLLRVGRLLIFVILRGWFFNERFLFLHFNIKLIWSRPFHGLFFGGISGCNKKISISSVKISVSELVKIFKGFKNEEDFIKRGSSIDLINEIFQIEPRFHNVGFFVIVSFEVVKLNLKEEFF